MTYPEIHTKVIRKLLYQRCLAANPVLPETVVDWFPAHDEHRVKRVVEQLAADPDTPLERADDGTTDYVCLSDIEAALTFLEKRDDIVPSGLDVYVQPPVPQ